MRALRFHEEARLELLHEVGYYTKLSPPLGERFDKAVQAAIRRAAAEPDLGSPYVSGTRRVFTRTFRFSVVYLTREEEIFLSSPEPRSAGDLATGECAGMTAEPVACPTWGRRHDILLSLGSRAAPLFGDGATGS